MNIFRIKANITARYNAIKATLQNKDFIKTIIRRRSYKKAVKSAEHLRVMYGCKYLVLFWKGEFRPMRKQQLKAMHQSGQFKKGLNMRHIEKMAVYSTH